MHRLRIAVYCLGVDMRSDVRLSVLMRAKPTWLGSAADPNMAIKSAKKSTATAVPVNTATCRQRFVTLFLLSLWIGQHSRTIETEASTPKASQPAAVRTPAVLSKLRPVNSTGAGGV